MNKNEAYLDQLLRSMSETEEPESATPSIEEPVEAPVEEAPVVEAPVEEAPAFEPSDDPNHVMTPEEIAALVASAPAEESIDEPIETPIEEVPIEGLLDDIGDDIPEEDLSADFGDISGEESSIDPDLMPEASELADLLEAIPELADSDEPYSMPEGLNVPDFGLDETSDILDGADELSSSFSESIGEGGDDIEAINDLLKAEGGSSEDDMLALLASTDGFDSDLEDSDEPVDFFAMDDDGEEREPSGSTSSGGSFDEESEEGPREKKKGFLAALIEKLFKKKPKEEEQPEEALDEEGDSGLESGKVVGEENQAILDQLGALDEEPDPKPEKKKKEKKKKEKKKKEKKPKKPKKAKPKKEKKPKEPKAAADSGPEIKISKKFAIALFVVCASFVGLVIFAVNKLPSYVYMSQARECFGKGDYEGVYKKLSGVDLESDDKELYEKSFVLLKMKRYAEMYDHWMQDGDDLRALDVLVTAVKMYDLFNVKAEEYGVLEQYNAYYAQILTDMDSMGISEEQAREFAAISDHVLYSIALENFLYGDDAPDYVLPENDESDMEELEAILQDETYTDEDYFDGSEPAQEYEEPEEAEEVPIMNYTVETDGNVSGGDNSDDSLYEFDVTKDSDGNYHAGQ